jgi:hypothetical protein
MNNYKVHVVFVSTIASAEIYPSKCRKNEIFDEKMTKNDKMMRHDHDRRGSEIFDGKMTNCMGKHMYAGIYTPLGVHAFRSKHGRVIIMKGQAVGFLTEK